MRGRSRIDVVGVMLDGVMLELAVALAVALVVAVDVAVAGAGTVVAAVTVGVGSVLALGAAVIVGSVDLTFVPCGLCVGLGLVTLERSAPAAGAEPYIVAALVRMPPATRAVIETIVTRDFFNNTSSSKKIRSVRRW
jgi:hypothetical protein